MRGHNLVRRILIPALGLALAGSGIPTHASADARVAALVHDAHAAYDQRDYTRALDLYEQAIRAGASKPTTFYNAGCSAALAGRRNDAFSYLNRAIEAGYTKADHLEADADFTLLRGDPRWAPLLTKTRAAAAALTRSMVAPAVREELLAMRHEDLALRRAHRTGTGNRPSARDLNEAEAKHAARLRAIVQQHGWPGRSIAGPDGAHAAWLVAWHADDPAFQRRCVELMAAAAGGEVDPQDLASLSDVVRLNEGKKQEFGTQFHRVKGRLVPRPIEDPAHVDERRRKLGLPPLAEYQKNLEQRRTAAADTTGS